MLVLSITGTPHRSARSTITSWSGADLGQPVEVLLERALASRRGVADHEVARMLLDGLDPQDRVNEKRALDLGRDEAGDEVDALDRHRPALVERPLDRGLDADEHLPRLVEEAGLQLRGRAARLEARDVHGRHVRRREVGADRLPDEVGGGDTGDPEAVGRLRRDRGLAGAGSAPDEQENRPVEPTEGRKPAHPLDDPSSLLLAEQLACDLLEPVELDGPGPRWRSGRARGASRARRPSRPTPRRQGARGPSSPSSTGARPDRRAGAGPGSAVASGGDRLRHEREESLVEPRGDDVVRGEDDPAAARERVLGDEVDRGALQLGQVGVRVEGRELAAESLPVAEARRDVDDVGLEMARARRARR